MDAALTPDASELTPPTATLPADDGTQEAIADEKTIADLVDHPGWRIFMDAIRKRIYKLETMHGFNFDGMDAKAIGEAYMVARKAAEALKDELANVEATAAGVRASK